MALSPRNQEQRRPQLFDDEIREPLGPGTRPDEGARTDEDGWVESFIERLAAAIRMIGGKH